MSPLFEVADLRIAFPRSGGKRLTAVNGVSLMVEAGKTVALVGESGCGKTTVGRAALRISQSTAIESGEVWFEGAQLLGLSERALLAYRQRMQMVFQDPASSLDPRMTVGDIVGEPLRVHRSELSRKARDERVGELLEKVGLASRATMRRYPHEFSGGQKQRIGIARALALDPKFMVLDEPTSALDVSVQAQIVELLLALQQERGIAYLFISHNIAIVERIAHRVGVMYLGELVEFGKTAEVVGRPQHPYTRALIAAVPVPDPVAQRARVRVPLAGDVPSPVRRPSGCPFHPRCPQAQGDPRCRSEAQALRPLPGSSARAACFKVTDTPGQ